MLRINQYPHRRLNPLTGKWVLVSPHRTARPWQGMVEKPAQSPQPSYDPECYLCPGNHRAGGAQNPQYGGTFVFDNDYAAMRPDLPDELVDLNDRGLIRGEAERGICRVVCFSPRHDLTLATMEVPAIEAVVNLWAEQFQELGAREFINHVQVFENRGVMMGASNPHPHCQIWANAHIPNEPAKELRCQAEWLKQKGTCMLCQYAEDVSLCRVCIHT